MSTLSELLPAGSGGKNVDFVASGTLTSGQTVALKTDGTVEAVGTSSQAIGATNQWATSAATQPSANAYGSVYDPDSQRVVVAYYDGNDNYYGYCVVGEVDPSNNTITFGTQVLFQSNFIIPHSIGYDTTNDKIVVFFQNVNSSSHGQARVGTFTGSTLSFPGSEATFNAGSTEDITAVFNPDQGTFLVVYKDNAASGLPYGAVGTVSGTSISFGSETQLDTNGTSYQALTYNTTANSYIYVYNKTSVTQQTYYQVPTTSGTTVTAGTPTLMTLNGSTTAQVKYTNLSSDNASNTVFLTFANEYDSNHAHAIAATISGSTLTFGTEVEFSANTTYGIGAVYDTSAQKLVVSYADTNQYGIVVVASVSGTTLTFGSPTTFRNASTNSFTNAYDSVNKKVVVTYYEQNTGYAGSVVFQPESTNVSDFIGITDAAIANTATGSVTIKGGIATAQTTGSGSIGTEVIYGSAGSNLYTGATFDSSNNRVVIVYRDGANSNYGTAVVGNVSGTSISFGTPVTYNTSGSTDPNAVGFDSNSNKVVVAYRDGGDSDKGKAIVGTVDPSNNSISFPSSEVEFNGGNTGYINVVFDSSNNRIVITYTDYGNSSAATAIAGTVSGNTISFGSEVVINSNGSYFTASTFDSTANKVVIAYQDAGNSNYGTANVLTVDPSNNSITFGADSVFNQATTSTGLGPTTFGIAFDSTNNRTVIAFCDEGNSNFGTAVVGTISSTSITFGTKVEFHQDAIYGMAAVFDPNSNKIVISYADQGNNYHGEYILGTVSNTSISFNTAQTFASATTQYIASTFDTNSNRVVNAYADTQGPTANNGTAIVIQPAGQSENLIPNSVYYVQTNGDINTTSTSPAVRLGKALSSTSINLEFNS